MAITIIRPGPVIDAGNAPYNLRGDGSTIENTGLQAAINAARGGTLVLREPLVFYRITDTMLIQPVSGSQVRLNIDARGSYSSFQLETKDKALFRSYGWMDSHVFNVKVYLNAHDTVAWDIEADINRQSTSSLCWDSCYVSQSAKYGCAGFRIGASGGDRDIASLSWRNTQVRGAGKTYGMIAYQNLSQNGLAWGWHDCYTAGVHTRYGDKTGFGLLSGSHDDTVTTITLDDARWLPYDGAVVIDSERVSYTSRSATQLLGCTRGAGGTTPASHVSGSLANEYTTGGTIGGAGMTFVADNNVGNRCDFFLNAAGSYLMAGGRYESGEQVLRTAIGGSTAPVFATLDGIEVTAYTGVSGSLFDLNTATHLELNNPFIRGIGNAADWTAAMIDGGGAEASTYGGIIVSGGRIRASDPCYQNLRTNWRTRFTDVVQSNGGDFTAVGYYS